MNQHVFNSYDSMSQKAAALIAAQLKKKPDSVIGLATGSTPIGTYRALIAMNKSGELDFSRARTVNLDEYRGLPVSRPQSYRAFMDAQLFDHINIDKANTHVPNGMAEDVQAECARYDALIDELGGVDLQLLGIGFDGHIGFNEPSDVFIAPTNCVTLDASTLEANKRFFDDISEVPVQALTMGMRQIMCAKKVLLLACGKGKEAVYSKAMRGPVTPRLPASILQLHPDVTWMYTEQDFTD